MTLLARSARFTAILALPWLVLAPALTARAFCRSTTVTPLENCPTVCPSDGLPLYWATPTIQYAFNQRAFPGLRDAELRGAIARSFARWTDVTCDGMQTGLVVEALAQTTTLTIGPQLAEPNLNVISVLTQSEWSALGYDPEAFAQTKIWLDPETGKIKGADLAFNGSIGTFAVCTEQSCPASVIDIENVATHEIGHFLGLGHSTDADTTMWCTADRFDRSKRTLSADDIAGLCAIYADGTAFESSAPKSHRAPSGCTISPQRASGQGPSALAFALGLFAVRLAARSRRLVARGSGRRTAQGEAGSQPWRPRTATR